MPRRDNELTELLLARRIESLLWLSIAQLAARRALTREFDELTKCRRRSTKAAYLYSRGLEPMEADEIRTQYSVALFQYVQFGRNGMPQAFTNEFMDWVVDTVPLETLARLRHLNTALQQFVAGFRLIDFAWPVDFLGVHDWWIWLVRSQSLLTLNGVRTSAERRGQQNYSTSVLATDADGSRAITLDSNPARNIIRVVQVPTSLPDPGPDRPSSYEQAVAHMTKWLNTEKHQFQKHLLFRRHDRLTRYLVALESIKTHCKEGGSEAGAIAESLKKMGIESTGENIRVVAARLKRRMDCYHPDMLPWRRPQADTRELAT